MSPFRALALLSLLSACATESIEDLNHRVDTLQEDGDTDLAAVIARLDAAEASLAALQSQSESGAARIAALEGALAAAEETIAAQEVEIQALQGWGADVDGQLQSAADADLDHDARLAALETFVGAQPAVDTAQDEAILALAGRADATEAAGYATTAWVTDQAYLTASALSGYATETWVDGQGYAVEADLGDLINFADYVTVNTSSNLITFAGANLQITNGAGTTHNSKNGYGNLIIGYNQTDPTYPSTRTGSHNLVIGDAHSYTGSGGVVFGAYNKISGYYGTVLGGTFNTASAEGAVVLGGGQNKASGSYSVVVGGQGNTSGTYIQVTGT